MAAMTKRAWKLQEYVAHGANVNCLALGPKSGRVLVTGGDDKKVNLWAVGKPNCIMSLIGHTTPVECVRFGHSEELVCAGALSGAIKIWDLEAAKIIRTLTGHKANSRALDFHPYGDFLASGSVDTNIKLWDIRRKGCIFTYKGHTNTVNSIKFSPDGRWIASAGEDGIVRLWDLPAGKMLAEFSGHSGPVNSTEFHPNEFLLASCSSDRTVKFWDLESFLQVSTTDGDSGAIRCIYFSADGECMFSGAPDVLKVYGWEPTRCFDTIPVGWGKISDLSISQEQLIGASFHLTNVSIYVVDLKRVQPFAKNTNLTSSVVMSPSFQRSTHLRKSFNRAKPSLSMKNSVKSSEDEPTTPEIEQIENEIIFPENQDQVFHPRSRELTRTPPERFPAPLEDLVRHHEPDPPRIESKRPNIHHHHHQHPHHSSELIRPQPLKPEMIQPEPVRLVEQPPAVETFPVNTLSSTYRIDHHQQQQQQQQRSSSSTTITNRRMDPTSVSVPIQVSMSEPVSVVVSSSHPYHSSSPPTSIRTEQIIDPAAYRGVVPNVRHTTTNATTTTTSYAKKMNINNNSKSDVVALKDELLQSDLKSDYSPSKMVDKSSAIERSVIVPMQRDHSVGLDFDEFLPLSMKRMQDLRLCGQQQPEMSEAEAISSIMKGHDSMIAVMTNRLRNLQIVYTLWSNKDLKTAVDSAIQTNDMSVIVDILNVLSFRGAIWTLDLCVVLLPTIYELIQSKYESYMLVGCSALTVILKNFASVIKGNMSAPTSIGTDLNKEERYNKCKSCYNHLLSIRAFVLKRQTLQGKLGQTFRELHIMLQALD